MIVKTRSDKWIQIRKLTDSDFCNLESYLVALSTETKRRFAPHAYNKQAICDFYAQPSLHTGYVAIDISNNYIEGYAIIRHGYIDYEYARLSTYGINLDLETDCTFAPSVADAWQSSGVGSNMFEYILADLKNTLVKRIFLWGGVQADNQKAINYYLKHGFRHIGAFDYHGNNYDMMLDLHVSKELSFG